jgi:hypothetical protein
VVRRCLSDRDSPLRCNAEADDVCGDLVPGVLNAGESVRADLDAAEASEQTDRSLDHPSCSSEADTVIHSATSDDRFDALCAQGVAGRLAVAATICESNIRMAAWPAAIAKNVWEVVDCRLILSMFAGIRSAVWLTDGTPFPSTTRVCYVPGFLRSAGPGPVVSPPPNASAMTSTAIANAALKMPALRSSVREKWVWRSSPTPVSLRHRSRLRAVRPEQLCSSGTFPKRDPVTSTPRKALIIPWCGTRGMLSFRIMG